MQKGEWSLVFHLDDGQSGRVGVIHGGNPGGSQVSLLPTVAADPDTGEQIFLGLDEEDQCLLLNRTSGEVVRQQGYPAGALAAYAYPDHRSDRIWFMYDGDKKTGCDQLACGEQGSSVTVFNRADGDVSLQATICVGHGHHVTTFLYPEGSQTYGAKAYVSNLLDGSISVVGNDPAGAAYLEVINRIDLLEADRDPDAVPGVSNNAFPHGKVYSSHTGKVYSLNNGYGTVAVLNPETDSIENRFELKVASNLLLSPDGRFLVGKGADRKSDPDHVVGRLTLIDAETCTETAVLDLPDLYPSTYRFNPSGDRLYVTSAATGDGDQREALRKDVLQIYDATRFPELVLLRECRVGVADCGRRPIGFLAGANGEGQRVFVPNPTDGTVSILGGDADQVIETVEVADQAIREFSFSIWARDISAC